MPTLARLGTVTQSESRTGSSGTSLLDGDRLIVSTNGYIFCLDPLTGQILWQNTMKGYGAGAPTSLVSARGQSSQGVVSQAAKKTADAHTANQSHSTHFGS